MAHTDIAPSQFIKVGQIYKLNDFNRARFLPWSEKDQAVCPYRVASNPGKFRSPEEYKYEEQTEMVRQSLLLPRYQSLWDNWFSSDDPFIPGGCVLLWQCSIHVTARRISVSKSKDRGRTKVGKTRASARHIFWSVEQHRSRKQGVEGGNGLQPSTIPWRKMQCQRTCGVLSTKDETIRSWTVGNLGTVIAHDFWGFVFESK